MTKLFPMKLVRKTWPAACSVVAATLFSPLLAQGCAMCKSSIAAQNDTVINSINTGILILLFPPLLILSAILYFAFRQSE